MRNILEQIAIKGTRNRREAIIEILEEYNIPYFLQEIEHKSMNYFKSYSEKYEEKSKLYKPKFDDPELDSFIDEDFDDLSEEEKINYEEQLDLITLYNLYGKYMDFGPSKKEEESIEIEYETKYLYNIIIKPSESFLESKNKILFSAHYDVVSNSTGANDNASSITILLKLIIELYQNNANIPVGFVFFDGEETGGIGSKEYIKKYVSTEEAKNELTLVNLDVCGCGDYIVIVDNIFNAENKSNFLTTNNILEKYNVVQAKSFPFSDASIFKREGIGTLSISVFPKEDVELLFEENKEEDLKNDTKSYLESFKRKHFGSYIWQYMHNGIYDDISYINYDIMNLTLDYIKEII
jgi:hypothetical protein